MLTTPVAVRHVASRSKVKGQSSPGATLAPAAADRLRVAVALLDDHADVRLHELGDVHDLRTRRGATMNFDLCETGA